MAGLPLTCLSGGGVAGHCDHTSEPGVDLPRLRLWLGLVLYPNRAVPHLRRANRGVQLRLAARNDCSVADRHCCHICLVRTQGTDGEMAMMDGPTQLQPPLSHSCIAIVSFSSFRQTDAPIPSFFRLQFSRTHRDEKGWSKGKVLYNGLADTRNLTE